MIRNHGEYQRTKRQADTFRQAVVEGERAPVPPGIAGKLHNALLDLTRSDLADFERDLAAYRRRRAWKNC